MPFLESFDQDLLAIESRYRDRDLDGAVERLAAGRRRHLALLESLDDAG